MIIWVTCVVRLTLKNPRGMPQALFYELSSARCYFDVLVMPEARMCLCSRNSSFT